MWEPRMIQIGNITDMTLEEVTAKIIDYRKSKFSDVIETEKSLEPYPFGGCGGDAKALLSQYISISDY